MLGKFKKKSKEEKESKRKKSDKSKTESKKKEEVKGSSNTAFVVLIVSLIIGAIFWVYGVLSRGGEIELWSGKKSVTQELPTNEEGLIIFEK